LKIYNTMSREVEEFVAREDGEVKIFTCGPSTYRRPHIGNYRTFMYEDILVRYLEYLGYRVDRVINFTDVEDKTIGEAQRQNRTIQEITNDVADHFFREAEILGLRLPETVPRATTSIDQAVHLVQILVEKGYAYWHDGDAFFDPRKFDGFGKLYGLDMSKWPRRRIRFRQDTYEGNRWNRGDFILWHGEKNMDRTGDDAVWDTEIGRGRPSWNIQDPAMVTKHLGYEIDINCGGIDNIYRHHDYNIAVIEAASGGTYANYYMHGEHLIVNGRTMSKSKGNILYPEDVLEAEGYEPRHLRHFLTAGAHYRRKLDYTESSFRGQAERLDECRRLIGEILGSAVLNVQSDPVIERLARNLDRDFTAFMNDDLSVGKAFEGVLRNVRDLKRWSGSRPMNRNDVNEVESRLRRIDSVLGVLF